jgi:hypothetical protein
VRLLYNNVAGKRQHCGYNDFGSIFGSCGSRPLRPRFGAAAINTGTIITIAGLMIMEPVP